MASAAVMSKSQDNIIQLVCYQNGLFMQVMPKQQLKSALENRQLSLGFDGQPLAGQPWKAVQVTKQDWDFDVGEGETGFQEAIAGFKQHREATISISESGKEVMRQDFTLQDADQTIDTSSRPALRKADGLRLTSRFRHPNLILVVHWESECSLGWRRFSLPHGHCS